MAETRGSPAKPSDCMLLHTYYKQDKSKLHRVGLVIAGVNLGNKICYLLPYFTEVMVFCFL
jgi:hypothetical protein